LRFDNSGAISDGNLVSAAPLTNAVSVPEPIPDTSVAPVAPDAATQENTTPDLTLTGDVVDPKSNPIPDATVELKSEDKVVATTKTNNKGKYSLSWPSIKANTSYALTVQKGNDYKSTGQVQISGDKSSAVKNIAIKKTSIFTKIMNFFKNLIVKK
jgi:hypothetical protein